MTIIVNNLPEDKWRAYLEQHPHSNIFHTPEMFQVLAQSVGHRLTLWTATDDDGQVLALLPVAHITLMGGPLRRLTTRAVAYGSVLYTCGPAGEEALETLLRAYTCTTRHQALFTELRHLSDTSAIQPMLSQCGFIYEDHLNYLIDLSCPLEQVMSNIGARTRKHIRQGLRKGEVIVEQATDSSLVQVCYDLIQKSYAAAHMPLADRSLFKAAFEVLYPRGMIQFWLARVGSAYAAASVELPYKNVIYGWYSGVDRQYADLSPGELLMWHILKWGVENGYKVYDFGGAGKPSEEYGVRDFKAKFGGRLVCFGRNTCIHSPRLLRLSEFGYRIYRRWFRQH
jgi:serine/alanine adding enzyme